MPSSNISRRIGKFYNGFLKFIEKGGNGAVAQYRDHYCYREFSGNF
jgi:hypothetical protein